MGAFLLPISWAFEFTTYEKAKKYIIGELPKEYKKELPTERHIYETF
jgi:hypothetical protein